MSTKDCLTVADLCEALMEGTLEATRWPPGERAPGDSRPEDFVVARSELRRWSRAAAGRRAPSCREGRKAWVANQPHQVLKLHQHTHPAVAKDKRALPLLAGR
jgi:hypothetical protein